MIAILRSSCLNRIASTLETTSRSPARLGAGAFLVAEALASRLSGEGGSDRRRDARFPRGEGQTPAFPGCAPKRLGCGVWAVAASLARDEQTGRWTACSSRGPCAWDADGAPLGAVRRARAAVRGTGTRAD